MRTGNASDAVARARWVILGMLLLAECVGVGSALQRTGTIAVPTPTQSAPPVVPDYGVTRPGLGTGLNGLEDLASARGMEEKRGKLMNSERQKMMVKEANQLVQMTADLQFTLARSPDGPASEEAIRRVDLVEKLARNVKERMKGGR